MLNIGVLGGGASGMVAALEAARVGAKVTIIEGQDRVGKKLLVTGNGRCNYVNQWIDLCHYETNNQEWLEVCLQDFGVEETVNYFRWLGIEPYFDDTGRGFPYSLQASSMVEVIREAYLNLGVIEQCGENVQTIKKTKSGYQVATNVHKYQFDKIIVALGGQSFQHLGSNGSGFSLLSSLNYEMTPIYPALVKLKSDFPHLKALQGLKVEGHVYLFLNGEKSGEDDGEILFANYGVSGPPILQISGYAAQALSWGHRVEIVIDLFPHLSQHQLYELLETRFDTLHYKGLKDTFVGLIHKRLIIPVLKEAMIYEYDIKPTKLSRKQVYDIVNRLKSLTLTITDFHSWKESQVTAGGIALFQICPKTLESLRDPGLFIAGEILDVHGACGGYNLHFAWCTGIKAGREAAKYNKENFQV